MTLDLQESLRLALPASYVLKGYLDEGGQGNVWSGTLDGQDVALKVFSPESDRRRIRNELDVLRSVSHPNLVKVKGFELIDLEGIEHILVAYEHLAGGDMRRYLSSESPPPDASTIACIGADIGSAIECLWDNKIVHRDIKPANILEAEDGRHVLIDLGIARYLDLSRITRSGHICGTPRYLSPEQAQGRRSLTVASDVFSFGVTLYEIASKQHPFHRDQASIDRILPTELSSFRSDLPPTLVSLIHRMMSVRPHLRPSSISKQFKAFQGG